MITKAIFFFRSGICISMIGLFIKTGAIAQDPSSQQDVQGIKETQVWSGPEDGVKSHRILALTVSRENVILAFSEARMDGSDEGPHDLVCKRSTDNGMTWSKTIIIEKSDGTFWNTNGAPGRMECWTNPAALTDRRTGQVFIFYALNEGRLQGKNTQRMTRVFYKTSSDNGITWSKRVEITDVLNATEDGSLNVDKTGQPVLNDDGFACDFLGRAFHMPGPGHGIQLHNGSLMLQFWHRKPIGRINQQGVYEVIPENERAYSTSTIYSNDHGKTWKQGGQTGLGHNATESRIVELANGDIMVNARMNTSSARWVATSTDRGRTWTARTDSVAISTPVDCGLIRVSGKGKKNANFLMFSHPRELHKREGMTVSLSYDSGKTWPVNKLVYPYGSSYSDLMQLPDGTFGLIYEKTYRSGEHTSSGVAFARFSYSWLTGK